MISFQSKRASERLGLIFKDSHTKINCSTIFILVLLRSYPLPSVSTLAQPMERNNLLDSFFVLENCGQRSSNVDYILAKLLRVALKALKFIDHVPQHFVQLVDSHA